MSRTFSRVFDPRGGVERGVVVELLHHLAERHPVLGSEIEPKRSFSSAMIRESVSSSSGAMSVTALGAHRVEHAGLRSSAIFPLPVCWIRYDSMSMFCCTSRGSSSTIGREQPPQVPSEDVELLQIGVGEGQHLRQEGVEPHVVGELAAEVVLLFSRNRP